ncbi:MAG TPA: protein translocase subunit SecD [Alphaproteobacteria bacterium]|nr:protein translocase subunit SecD [Paracoccaceae bacterium]RCL79174.1 MAG: protein translocase subunit SecD [SAR116 cluster bacterium]HBQ22789.1 protein translocase subunit SecD [Alphaproteobacteria bacterium]HCY48574.1 protein translocase subunit SecD [Alphaproteobacteria bacterium]|tara:strand:+ start:4092 stop:5693 length:1602 start_codon:yes stop_codon:yes gene_type:complete
MITIPPWQRIGIILLVAFGLLAAIPTFIGKQASQEIGILPGGPIELGLDLQGGAHLLLEVASNDLVAERLENIRDDVRDKLRRQQPAIGYRRLDADRDLGQLTITLRDMAELDAARERLEEMDLDGDGLEINESDTGLVVGYGENGREELIRRSVAQAIEVLRRRIDPDGTKEPSIQAQGSDRIIVQVPGESNLTRLRDLITQTARMTFHLVCLGDEVNCREVASGDGYRESYQVVRRPALTGESLVDAGATTDETGQPAVSFRFDTAGARLFADLTEKNVGRPFAIVLDSGIDEATGKAVVEVISAPRISVPIRGGSGIIEGNFTFESANDLSILLRAGALPAPLRILEERSVGPDLGSDSVEAGKIAAFVGLMAVLVFMGFYYRIFGLIAAFALLSNMFLIIGALGIIGATLTLPGIAGIVLTMGMAVDANVLIFERIREERARGTKPLLAIDAGYRRAMSTILDANVTTFIAAMVLFVLGAGPIKGFAVTLSIGIITSVFSAVFLTRLIIVTWMRSGRPKKLSGLEGATS